MSIKVLIAGGGIGGLCLAQGLRRAGVGVAVYERDASVDARGQGYRLRIDSDGDGALQECLPPPLYTLYRATTNRPSRPPVGAFDHHLNLIYQFPAGGTARPADHLSVNRHTLRQVLLGELEDVVHFGQAVTAFEPEEDGVRVRLTEGDIATGDVLVAADGINSMIRRQILPRAEIADTGMRCIYGKTLLNDQILSEMPEPLFGGFTPVLGPDRCTLALGLFRPCRPPHEAATEFAPAVRLDPVPPYLMWMFVAPADTDPRVAAASAEAPATLHRSVRERISGWHPDLRRLLECADVPSTFPVPIRTAQPVASWTPGRVTLLGDAIHAMTPAGGIGANTALRDATRLTRGLIAADRGDEELIAAIASYETAMRDYGFAAVERSLQGATAMYRITLPERRPPA